MTLHTMTLSHLSQFASSSTHREGYGPIGRAKPMQRALHQLARGEGEAAGLQSADNLMRRINARMRTHERKNPGMNHER